MVSESDLVCKFRSVLVSLLITVSLALLGSFSQPRETRAQTYQAQGPAPITKGGVMMPDSPVVGAIQAIAPDPNNANTLYIGAVNGGIWKTTNGGANWVPLTDFQSSLSIGALTLDADNPNRLLAGLGIFSNSRGNGGPQNGLLYSSNGGSSWTPMGALMLKKTNISSLLFQDQFILAASRENLPGSDVTGANTGLFCSLDGGKSFISLSGAGGLPAGSVTSLAWSGSPTTPIYAAVLNQGIYRSNDAGKTWTNITIPGMNIQGGNPQNIQLSVGAGGKSLYAGIVNSLGILGSVWRSTDQGKTWTNMGGSQPSAKLSQGLPGTIENGKFFGIHVPDADEGGKGQGDINFAILANPQNSNLVYISGQAQPDSNKTPQWPNSIGATTYYGRLFMGNATGKPSDPPSVASWTPVTPYNGQWVPLTDNFANGTAPHADSRWLAFDANGNLLQSDDGGIYLLSNPGTSQQAWSSLNGNLQISEFYSVSYDSNTKTLLGGVQDNGVAVQSAPGSLKWLAVDSGDGAMTAINDSNSAFSVRYFSSQQLGDVGGFDRWKVDKNDPLGGQAVQTTLKVGNQTLQAYDKAAGSTIPAIAPMVLNQADMTKLAFGTQRVYLATDNVSGTLANTLALTDISSSNFVNPVSALAYGRAGDPAANIAANPNLLLVGEGKNLWLSTNLQPGSLQQLDNYSGGDVKSLLINPFSDQKFYVADGSALQNTNDQGTTWIKDISLLNLQALQFINKDNPGDPSKNVKAVLAGGYGTLYAARDTDLNNWYSLASLPNTFVSSLDYSAKNDVLAIGTMGRGAFTLSKASTLIPPTAPVSVDTGWIRLLRDTTGDQTLNGGTLQTPDPMVFSNDLSLTTLGGTFDTAGSNVTIEGAISGPGSFAKAGDGTLTLVTDNTYAGGTIFNAGTVDVSTDSNLGATFGRLTFNGGTLQVRSNFSSSRTITLNAFGGIFDTGTDSDFSSTLAGVISGPGTFLVLGSGSLSLQGNNSYEGGTILNGGEVGSTLTLNVMKDANLGAANGTLSFNGGTLKALAGLTTSRIISIQDSGGTFDTGGFKSILNGLLFGTAGGIFTQTGAGTGSLTLNGDGSAFAGTFRVNSGTFILNNALGSTQAPCNLNVANGSSFSGDGALLGGLALQGNGSAFTGLVSVPGTATLSGNGALNGTLILKGDGSGYGGTYTVPNNSFCVLDNQFGSAANRVTVNVQSGGRINGIGKMVGALSNQGIILPGDSPGTLSINGSYTQGATGTYIAEVASATSYDQISVTGAPGTASLSGVIAPTLLGNYRPRAGQVFPGVVATTGGVAGTFNNVVQPLTLNWQPVYNATSVNLQFQSNYANPALGLTSNGQAVGTMLNEVSGSGPTGDMGALLNTIDGLGDAGAVADAYKQISPEKAGALTNLGFVAANFQVRNLATRITNLRFIQGASGGGSSLTSGLSCNYSNLDGLMLAYNGASISNLFSARKEFRAPESHWGLFADGGAAFGSQNSTVNQTGYNFTLGGFTLGADYRLRDNLLVGLATGYSNTASGFYSSGGTANANTIPFNVYAAYFPGSLYAYGSLGYALNLYDLERGINFGGLARTASSSTTGNQFNLYGETGYDLKFSRFILTPSVTLAYSALWVNGFTETGAGALNLKVGAQSANSLQTGLGGRLTVPLQVGSMTVVPQGYAFYQHEFANGSRGLSANLSQGSGTFNFQTDVAGRNFALLGASVTVGLKKNLFAQVNFNAEVGRGNSSSQFVNAGLRWEF